MSPVRQETSPGSAFRRLAGDFLISVLFTLSGVAALIYQVCWQRSLFSLLGVDLESTTIVVSVFMLGLGCGALIGGRLADAYPARRLQMFAAAEAATALYGFLSVPIIGAVAASPGMGFGHIAGLLKSSLVLILPTTLMGMTLPILVTHLFSGNRNVGVSVGQLYFVNTVGGAIGAGLATFYLFAQFGLSASVRLASALDLLVAVAAFGVGRLILP